MFLTFPTKEISFNKIRKIKIKKIIYHNPLQLLISSITIYFSFQSTKIRREERSKSNTGWKKGNSQETGWIYPREKVRVRKEEEAQPFHQLYYSRSRVVRGENSTGHLYTSINFLQTMLPELFHEKKKSIRPFVKTQFV